MRAQSDVQAEADKRAREYVDRIAAVNQRHGMGRKIPKQQYERAVRDAARLFAQARGTNTA